jgi:hypothetical protein
MESQYDDWVVVPNANNSQNTKPFSAERPAQLKTANMSSNQVAGTNAADSLLAAQLQTKLNIGPNPYDPTYDIDHKPPSHITDNTDSSGTTVQADVTAAATTTFPSPAFIYNSTGLTKTSLEQQQLLINALSPGDIRAWLEGAVPGYSRFALSMEYNRHSHAGRSHPSQASDASYELVMSPNTDASREQAICAAGALFDEQCTNPFVYTQHLTFSEA